MRAFVSLGSNLGDRMEYLRQGLDSLPGVTTVSPIYESEPVGGPEQGAFLNLVAELDVEVTPLELLSICHRVESAANRVRDERWGPRTLDVDIIWIDGVEIETDRLTVPHPRWKERRFVLAPLRDLAPELVSDDDIEQSIGTVRQVDH